jgi:hypothetical protein
MGASNNVSGLGSAIGGANINNFIGDNIIEAVRYGIYWRARAGLVDQFLTISRNRIGGNVGIGGFPSTTFIGGGLANAAGIYIKGVLQGTIDSNIIKNSSTKSTIFEKMRV